MRKGIVGGFVLIFLVWNCYMGVRFMPQRLGLHNRHTPAPNGDLFRSTALKNARRLRRYPPHRYYKLNTIPRSNQPSFLTTETEYIYGEWPIALQLRARDATMRQSNEHGPVKVAVDQTSWLPPMQFESFHNQDTTSRTDDIAAAAAVDGPLPFADGTNPSIISVDRLAGWKQRTILLQQFPEARFLATACMTNSQCAWRDSPSEIRTYHIPTQEKPDTIRTVLLILNESFQSIAQTTIYLERDAGWGRKLRQPGQLYLPALDDARLFRHDHQLFVSYREGPGFGYETQVLNPVHIEFGTTSTEWTAHIRASETSSFCCGRNMALMKGDGDSHLRALTWVDPVTIVDVDTTPGATNKKPRRKLAAEEQGKKKHKSHIHGTNGFMVDIPSDASSKNGDYDHVTFLGVAHFHRPNDRQENPYARFGHHYTHAFYTIRNDQLVGLSPEFVLPSKYDKDDGEVIQFLSGLEYDDKRNEVVIAYGINDCEAAVEVVDLQVVRQFLRPVQAGKQVVDFMMPLKPL